MPRNGSGIYSVLPGTDGFPDTTIESAKYNSYIHDVETDLNLPRPIVAGGTGANDANEALVNLQAEKSSQRVTNYDTHVFYPGSFYSDTNAVGAPVFGTSGTPPVVPPGSKVPLNGTAVSSDIPAEPPLNRNVVLQGRDTSGLVSVPGRVWVREKKDNVWGAWTLDNTGISSSSPPANPPDNTLWFDSISGSLYIYYNDGNSSQWVIASPQVDPGQFLLKSGDTMLGPLTLQSSPTSDLMAANKSYVDSVLTTTLAAVEDKVDKAGDTMTGTLVAPAVTAQYITVTGNGADGIVQVDKGGTGSSSYVLGTHTGVNRWNVVLGDVTVESGGNAGSNFSINSFTDAGAYFQTPFSISRGNGSVTIPNVLNCNVVVATSFSPLLNAMWTAFGSNPALQMDTSDYLYYDRATNQYGFIIGGAGILNINNTTSTFATNLLTNYSVSANGALNEFCMVQSGGVYYQSFALTVGHYFYLNSASGDMNYRQFGVDRFGVKATDGILYAYINGAKPGGGAWVDSSDARIKNVQGDFTRGLDAVAALRPVTYTFKGNDTHEPPAAAVEAPTFDAQGKEIPKSAKRTPETAPYPNSAHYDAATKQTKYAGLIAQEVQSVLPEMVTSQAGYVDGQAVSDLLTLDTTPLIFALVNAVKELKARVEALEGA